MADFQFTPTPVITGEPVSTAIASALATIGASFMAGSAKSKGSKASERAADIERQAGETRAEGENKMREIAALDPNAPELHAYAAFVNQHIANVASPAHEQTIVREEGDRVLAQVRARVERQQKEAKEQSFGQALGQLHDSFSKSLAGLGESFTKSLEQREAETSASIQNLQSGLQNARIEAAVQRQPEPPAPAPGPSPIILGLIALGVVVVLVLVKRKR